MRNKLIFFLIFIISLTSVSAVSSPAVEVTGLTCSYERNCAVFKWDAGTVPDFNNFIFYVTSTDSVIQNSDTNTNGTNFSLCGMSPDKTVAGTVTKYDGNADGLFTNAVTASCTVDPGGTVGGGRFLIYNMFIALGSIIGLIIIVAIAALVLLEIFGIGIFTILMKRFK